MKKFLLAIAILLSLSKSAEANFQYWDGGQVEQTTATQAIGVPVGNVPLNALVVGCVTWVGGDGTPTMGDGTPNENLFTALSDSVQNTTHAKAFYQLKSLKSGSVTFRAQFPAGHIPGSNMSMFIKVFASQSGTSKFFSSANGAGTGISLSVGPFSEPVGPGPLAVMCTAAGSAQTAQSFDGYNAVCGGFSTCPATPNNTSFSSISYRADVSGNVIVNGHGKASITNNQSSDWVTTAMTFYDYNTLPWASSFSNSDNCSDWLTFDSALNCGTATDANNKVLRNGRNWCNFDVNSNTQQPIYRGYTPNATYPNLTYFLGDHWDEISAVSNYSGSGGQATGRGFRHFTGGLHTDFSGYSGGGGMTWNFDPYPFGLGSPGYQEMYIRSMMRWQSGAIFGANRQFKIFLYSTYQYDFPNDTGLRAAPIFLLPEQAGVVPLANDSTWPNPGPQPNNISNNLKLKASIYMQNVAGCTPFAIWGYCGHTKGCDDLTNPGCGWKDMYPTGVSDGSWHEVQVYIKFNTYCSIAGPSCPTQDGRAKFWLDGRLIWDTGAVLTFYNPLLQGRVGIASVGLETNGNAFINYDTQGCWYIDHDDMAISPTGPIATISTALKTPKPPTGLGVTQ